DRHGDGAAGHGDGADVERDHAARLREGPLSSGRGDEAQVGAEGVGENRGRGVAGAAVRYGHSVGDVVAFVGVRGAGVGDNQVGGRADDRPVDGGGIVGGVGIAGGAADRGGVGEVRPGGKAGGGGYDEHKGVRTTRGDVRGGRLGDDAA